MGEGIGLRMGCWGREVGRVWKILFSLNLK